MNYVIEVRQTDGYYSPSKKIGYYCKCHDGEFDVCSDLKDPCVRVYSIRDWAIRRVTFLNEFWQKEGLSFHIKTLTPEGTIQVHQPVLVGFRIK